VQGNNQHRPDHILHEARRHRRKDPRRERQEQHDGGDEAGVVVPRAQRGGDVDQGVDRHQVRGGDAPAGVETAKVKDAEQQEPHETHIDDPDGAMGQPPGARAEHEVDALAEAVGVVLLVLVQHVDRQGEVDRQRDAADEGREQDQEHGNRQRAIDPVRRQPAHPVQRTRPAPARFIHAAVRHDPFPLAGGSPGRRLTSRSRAVLPTAALCWKP